jgi:DNA-binding transcriptional LysR family regulator
VPRRITSPEHYLDLVAAGQGVALTLASPTERPQVRKLTGFGPTPAISNVYLVWRRGRRPDLVATMVSVAPGALAEHTQPEPALTG